RAAAGVEPAPCAGEADLLPVRHFERVAIGVAQEAPVADRRAVVERARDERVLLLRAAAERVDVLAAGARDAEVRDRMQRRRDLPGPDQHGPERPRAGREPDDALA